MGGCVSKVTVDPAPTRQTQAPEPRVRPVGPSIPQRQAPIQEMTVQAGTTLPLKAATLDDIQKLDKLEPDPWSAPSILIVRLMLGEPVTFEYALQGIENGDKPVVSPGHRSYGGASPPQCLLSDKESAEYMGYYLDVKTLAPTQYDGIFTIKDDKNQPTLSHLDTAIKAANERLDSLAKKQASKAASKRLDSLAEKQASHGWNGSPDTKVGPGRAGPASKQSLVRTPHTSSQPTATRKEPLKTVGWSEELPPPVEDSAPSPMSRLDQRGRVGGDEVLVIGEYTRKTDVSRERSKKGDADAEGYLVLSSAETLKAKGARGMHKGTDGKSASGEFREGPLPPGESSGDDGPTEPLHTPPGVRGKVGEMFVHYVPRKAIAFTDTLLPHAESSSGRPGSGTGATTIHVPNATPSGTSTIPKPKKDLAPATPSSDS